MGLMDGKSHHKVAPAAKMMKRQTRTLTVLWQCTSMYAEAGRRVAGSMRISASVCRLLVQAAPEVATKTCRSNAWDKSWRPPRRQSRLLCLGLRNADPGTLPGAAQSRTTQGARLCADPNRHEHGRSPLKPRRDHALRHASLDCVRKTRSPWPRLRYRYSALPENAPPQDTGPMQGKWRRAPRLASVALQAELALDSTLFPGSTLTARRWPGQAQQTVAERAATDATANRNYDWRQGSNGK